MLIKKLLPNVHAVPTSSSHSQQCSSDCAKVRLILLKD